MTFARPVRHHGRSHHRHRQLEGLAEAGQRHRPSRAGLAESDALALGADEAAACRAVHLEGALDAQRLCRASACAPTPRIVHLVRVNAEPQAAAASGQVDRSEGRVDAALAHERQAHVAAPQAAAPGRPLRRAGLGWSPGARRRRSSSLRVSASGAVPPCPPRWWPAPSVAGSCALRAPSASRRLLVVAAATARDRERDGDREQRQSRAKHPSGCNGQPEETTTRHQPASIPSSPKRGRTCQSRQPGSPMSACETRTQRMRRGVGQHLLDQAPVLLLHRQALRRARAANRPARRASASLSDSSSPSESSRGRAAGHAGAARRSVRGHAEQASSVSSRSSRATWPRSVAPRGAPRSGPAGRAAAQVAAGADHPPIGALGFEPQKICVPTIPTMCTSTVFSTIDFAVAVPTPTGPPEAL